MNVLLTQQGAPPTSRNLQNLTRLFRAACWTPKHYLPPLHNPSCRCLFFWKSVPFPHRQRKCLCAVRLCVFVLWTRTTGPTEKLNIQDGSRFSDNPSRLCALIILNDDFSAECVCVLSPVCVYFPVTIGRAQSQARFQAPDPWPQVDAPCPPSFIPHTRSEQKSQTFSHQWVDVWEGSIIDYWFCLCFTRMLLFLSSEASRNVTATIWPFEV